MIKSRSFATLIGIGLAWLTLSLVLLAHFIGMAPSDNQSLMRTRLQAVELVAAQCSPLAVSEDINTMTSIVRQLATDNGDIVSAGLRRRDGSLAWSYGAHPKTWAEAQAHIPTGGAALSVPIIKDSGDWGSLEVCFAGKYPVALPYVPRIVNESLSGPGMRVGVFTAAVGIVLYSLYLWWALRQVDPSNIIPPRVRSMLDSLAEGIVLLDHDGRIVLANEGFCRAAGFHLADIQGRLASELEWTMPHSDERASDVPWTKALANSRSVKGMSLGMKFPEIASDGTQRVTRRIFTVNAAPVLAPDGTLRGAMVTFDDVTEEEEKNLLLQQSRDEVERQNAQLRGLATIDSLTGCLNRRSFLEQFEAFWANPSAKGRGLGCVMVDVDRFKSVNDRFGHAAGDEVLKKVSRILLEQAAVVGGSVCRYGGEEFCLLFSDKDLVETGQIAERLRVAVESERWQQSLVTASFGYAVSEQGAGSVKDFLDQVDQALYTSKRTGRNRVTAWERHGDPTESSTNSGEQGGGELPALLRDPSSQSAFQALTSALAYRHAGTALHSRRVANMCLEAAPGLLTPDEAAQLEVAALLHDVGKIGIPDSILLKPGRLSREEWEIMCRHDQYGVDLVIAAGLPTEVVSIIAGHHIVSAKADQGPEDGESATVLTSAKLLCIADSYDAMTSNRPYHEPKKPEQAFAELRRCGGKQFETELVEHFIKAMTRSMAKKATSPREAA
jgi:diguanylate cyclase (GGDEF)-like protein/PAS domain S-box-containing protein/putative nucleotidyltransferase with HDIG domain